jgi:hypothetical protein
MDMKRIAPGSAICNAAVPTAAVAARSAEAWRVLAAELEALAEKGPARS